MYIVILTACKTFASHLGRCFCPISFFYFRFFFISDAAECLFSVPTGPKVPKRFLITSLCGLKGLKMADCEATALTTASRAFNYIHYNYKLIVYLFIY